VTLNDADISEVYDNCVDWSGKRKGKILEEKKPHYLQIVPTRKYDGYLQAGGVVYISLAAFEGNVELEIKTPKLRGGSFGLLNNYNTGQSLEWVEDLLSYLGVNLDDELLRIIYPKKYANALIIWGIFLSFIFISCFYAPIYCSIVFFSLYFSVFFFLMGSLYFYFIMFPQVRELVRAVKRRFTLY